MKKLFITLAIGLVFFAVQQASAQDATRIQFAKGKSSAIVSGTTGEYGITYVIRAKGGQNMVLTLTPRTGVGIKVEADRTYGHTVLLKEEKGGTYEVGIEEDGDCTIFIGSTTHKSIPFTLNVTIKKGHGDI